ncbi:MAG: TAXI family TRAP transporter solute-binding subunit [Cypionkella sp.]|nr:TAXI family TRAP transporter solute-binding subunit [Cypionkella sp.]
MFFTFQRFISVAFLVGFGCAQVAPVQAQTQLATIAGGGVAGVYYAAAGGMCRLLNKDRVANVRCAVEVSQGSVANVALLRRGSSPFALLQADVHYNAFKGTEGFAGIGAQPQIRSVLSLYPELVTLVVGSHVTATHQDALKGLRISRGVSGSGSRATLDSVFTLLGWSQADFGEVVERPTDEQSYALCEKKLDGFGYLVGHPASNVMRTVKNCGAKIVPMSASAIAKLISEKPYFVETEIQPDTYPGQSNAVASVGLLATLVANESTPEPLVYALVKAVFENLEDFKKTNPAFANLQAAKMIKDGLTAPLHPGALRYYKEMHWL